MPELTAYVPQLATPVNPISKEPVPGLVGPPALDRAALQPSNASCAILSAVPPQGTAPIVVSARDRMRAGRLTPFIFYDDKPFADFTRFLRASGKSLKTELQYARAVALLISFIIAKAVDFESQERRRELYVAFAHSLRFGTIREGLDPDGLWWSPLKLHYVSTILHRACAFSDWLLTEHDVSALNPTRMATLAEQISLWRRRSFYKYNALLGHISGTDRNSSHTTRAFKFAESIPLFSGDPPAFPVGRFADLMRIGFVRQRYERSTDLSRRLRIRDMMVALLLEGGGLRDSEPFHIFVGDVQADPEDDTLPIVRVFHPTDGHIRYVDPITGTLKTTNRAAYLRAAFDRVPLNVDSTKNGWKGNLLQAGGYMPVYWFPRDYGRLFFELYKIYVLTIRPITLPHPWLFVTIDGEPLTAKAYTKLHAKAVIRTGLKVEKGLGTTPHGHRHAFALRVNDAVKAGILDTKIFMLMMHHRSLLSQNTYNQPDIETVNAALKVAELRMPIDELAKFLGRIS